LRRRHEERGSHSMARDVPDDDGNLGVRVMLVGSGSSGGGPARGRDDPRQREPVVKIAGDVGCREVGGRDIEALGCRFDIGKPGELDVPGLFELTREHIVAHPLETDAASDEEGGGGDQQGGDGQGEKGHPDQGAVEDAVDDGLSLGNAGTDHDGPVAAGRHFETGGGDDLGRDGSAADLERFVEDDGVGAFTQQEGLHLGPDFFGKLTEEIGADGVQVAGDEDVAGVIDKDCVGIVTALVVDEMLEELLANVFNRDNGDDRPLALGLSRWTAGPLKAGRTLVCRHPLRSAPAAECGAAEFTAA